MEWGHFLNSYYYFFFLEKVKINKQFPEVRLDATNKQHSGSLLVLSCYAENLILFITFMITVSDIHSFDHFAGQWKCWRSW